MGEQFKWNPSTDRMGQMLLQAVYMEDQVTLEHLIKQKADLEAQDETGATPLTIAATRNMPNTVSWLLAKRANCTPKDSAGYSALTWACIKGNLEVVRLLLNAQADLQELVGSNGKTPLSMAAERGHQRVVEELLAKRARVEQPNEDGSTALMCAAHQCEAEVVYYLLSRNSIVNVADSEGWTALMHTMNAPAIVTDGPGNEGGERKVLVEGVLGKKTTLELLLLHKADVSAQAEDGLAPLIIGASNERPTAIKQLLEANAQANMATQKGQTAMIMAAAHDLSSVVKTLIIGNADVNQPNAKGDCPLSEGERLGHKDVVELLKKAGALPPKGGKKKKGKKK